LYKRSFSGPYLLCIHLEASELLLEELHEGICGSHTGGRSLSHKALTQGYRWPNMQKEAQEYVRKYDQCQIFALNIHQLGSVIDPLSNPWPFTQWGIRDGCWSAWITSPNELKLSHWKISRIWMPKDLFGKILSLGLESLVPSSQTMIFSLIAKLSGGTVVT